MSYPAAQLGSIRQSMGIKTWLRPKDQRLAINDRGRA
jgi:hypothetical protein